MKLQNDQTGQVENFCIDKDQICSCDRAFVYDSLAQLQEAGWKDYEEPKDFWYIDDYETISGSVGEKFDLEYSIYTEKQVEKLKAIGNYFETEEEAEKVVEKLRAWKRLEDKGFSFGGWEDFNSETNAIYFSIPENNWDNQTSDDLTICFGDEE